jgi:hypothetical protein
LPTIRSRAQIIRFGILKKADLLKKMDVEDWILESSGGRLDRIEALQSEELMGYRTSAKDLLRLSRQGRFDAVLDGLKEGVTSRESALWVVKFWKEIIRDLWVSHLGPETLIHPDINAEIKNDFVNMTDSHFVKLTERVQKLENGLNANLDVQINVEVFLRDLSA